MVGFPAAACTGDQYVAARLQQVDEFLRTRKVPRSMAERIHGYFTFILRRQVSHEQNTIMNGECRTTAADGFCVGLVSYMSQWAGSFD